MAREPVDEMLPVADHVKVDQVDLLDDCGLVEPVAKQVDRRRVAIRLPAPPRSQRPKLDLGVEQRLQLVEIAGRECVRKRRAGALIRRRSAGI